MEEGHVVFTLTARLLSTCLLVTLTDVNIYLLPTKAMQNRERDREGDEET